MNETPGSITPPTPPRYREAVAVRSAPIADDGTIVAKKRGFGPKFFLQLGISLTALFFILRQARLKAVFDEMKEADVLYLAPAAFMALFGMSIGSFRWGRLTRALGHSVSFGFLFKSYLVGTFFNTFLPTMVGGDIVRAADLAKKTKCGGMRALTIIILDRLTGIVGMFVLAVPAVMLVLGEIGGVGGNKVLIAATPVVFVVFFFVGGWFLTHPEVVKRMLAVLGKLPVIKKFAAKFTAMFETTSLVRERPQILFGQVAWAVLLQLNVIVHCWLIGLAYGIQIGFLHYLWIVPLFMVLPMFIPALGGHGVREGVAVLLLCKIQGAVGMSVAVAWSLTYAVLQMAWGLVGAAVFAARGTESKRGRLAVFAGVGLAVIVAAAVFLALPEKPQPRADPAQRFVFCFGDSHTASIYPEVLSEALNPAAGANQTLKFVPYKVDPKGRPGFNSAQLLHALQTHQWLLRYDPDVVVLQFGTNDVREDQHQTSLAAFKKNAAALIEEIVKKKNTRGVVPRVILCTIPPLAKKIGPLTGESARRISDELNPALVKLAAEKGLPPLVDIHGFLLARKAEWEKLYAPDGVHLSKAGYEEWAKLCAVAVKEVLRKAEETAPVAPAPR